VFLVHYKGAGALPLHIGVSTLPGPFTLLTDATIEKTLRELLRGVLFGSPAFGMRLLGN
jgi:hypothetical protein